MALLQIIFGVAVAVMVLYVVFLLIQIPVVQFILFFLFCAIAYYAIKEYRANQPK